MRPEDHEPELRVLKARHERALSALLACRDRKHLPRLQTGLARVEDDIKRLQRETPANNTQ